MKVPSVMDVGHTGDNMPSKANPVTGQQQTYGTGDTALMAACKYGHTKVISTLALDSRIDVQLKAQHLRFLSCL